MAFRFSPCLPCCTQCIFCVQPIHCDGVFGESINTTVLPSGSLVVVYDTVSGVDGFSFRNVIASGYTYASGLINYATCFSGDYKSGDHVGVVIRSSGHLPYSGIQTVSCTTFSVFTQKDEPRQIDFNFGTCAPISGVISLSGSLTAGLDTYTYSNTLPLINGRVTFSGLPYAGGYVWNFSFSDPGWYRQSVFFSGGISICKSGFFNQTIHPDWGSGWLCCGGEIIHGPDWKWTVTTSCGSTTDCFYQGYSVGGPGSWNGTGGLIGKTVACSRSLDQFTDAYFCSDTDSGASVSASAGCGSAGMTFNYCDGATPKVAGFFVCSGGTPDACWSDALFNGSAGNCFPYPNNVYHPCTGPSFSTSVGASQVLFSDSSFFMGTGSGTAGPSFESPEAYAAKKYICGEPWSISATRVLI